MGNGKGKGKGWIKVRVRVRVWLEKGREGGKGGWVRIKEWGGFGRDR